MNIECIYQTPRRLCDVVSPLANEKLGKLTKRPWNRFNPDLTSWWLVPNTKTVHFNSGKYYFNWGDKKHTTLLAGLYIEKGLDEKISAVYSSRKAKNFIMNDNWAWFSFLEGMKNMQLFENIRKNCPKDIPIEFIIDGGYVAEPTSFDPYQEKTLGWDKYIFSWLPEGNNLTLASSERKAFILKFHHIKTINDLIESISACSENEWLWLNIHIAVRLNINPSAIEKESTWSDSILWHKYLNSLNTWIK